MIISKPETQELSHTDGRPLLIRSCINVLLLICLIGISTLPNTANCKKQSYGGEGLLVVAVIITSYIWNQIKSCLIIGISRGLGWSFQISANHRHYMGQMGWLAWLILVSDLMNTLMLYEHCFDTIYTNPCLYGWKKYFVITHSVIQHTVHNKNIVI